MTVEHANLEHTERLNQRELAKALGVAPSQITRYKRMGAPISEGFEAIQTWRENNLANQSKLNSAEIDGDIPDPIPVSGDCAYDVLSRTRDNEQIISSEIHSLTVAINRARRKKSLTIDDVESRLNEKKIAKYSQMLKVARKEHREAVKSLLFAESAVVALEEQRGNLVSLDAAKDLIAKTMMPLINYLRKLPEDASNDIEKLKLTEVSNHGLAIIRGEE